MAEHSADDESFARMEKMSSEKRMKAADEQRKDVAVTLSGKVAGVETKQARAAQNQGTVVDAAGNAVPYATVQVGATNAVTTADENGNFQLNQPSTAESVRAVSYTHLDVYKRQVLTLIFPPFTVTIAPAIGLPEASVTVPVTTPGVLSG